MAKQQTLLSRLDRTPPPVCRIAAIKRGCDGKTRRKIIAELSALSGVPARTIINILYLPSWESVKIGTASRISDACGVKLWIGNPMGKFFKTLGEGDGDYLTKPQREACERARKGKP